MVFDLHILGCHFAMWWCHLWELLGFKLGAVCSPSRFESDGVMLGLVLNVSVSVSVSVLVRLARAHV